MESLNKEKDQVKKIVEQSFKKAIIENFETLDNFAKQKGISKEDAERIFNQDFKSIDQFLEALYYTNSSITFLDCFGNEFIFPQPKQSDCTDIM